MKNSEGQPGAGNEGRMMPTTLSGINHMCANTLNGEVLRYLRNQAQKGGPLFPEIENDIPTDGSRGLEA